jgi:Flp pilus assembly protein TadG
MKTLNNLRGAAMALRRGFLRAEVPSRVSARARSLSGRLGCGDEGQALVELALVLPMLLTVITGVLIFGIYEMQMLSLTEGVASAGRVLAVSAGAITDPCAAAATAVHNAAPVLNTANLSYTITLDGHVQTGATCNSTTSSSPPASYLATGTNVTVQATFNACSLKFYGINLTPGGCSITQTITEVVQ